MGDQPKARRDAQRKSNGSNGGGSFKECGQQRDMLNAGDYHSSCEKQQNVQEKNSGSTFYGFFRDTPFEKLGVLTLEKYRDSGGDHDGNRGSFHTSGSGARGAADKHQKDDQHLSGLAEGCKISGIETCGSGSYRLKQSVQNPFAQRKMRKFTKEEINGWKQDQSCSDSKDHFALHSVFAKMPGVLFDVFPGEKTDAADYDQSHDGEVHQWLGGIGGKRGEGFSYPQQIKTCIAESRDGVKKRIPNTFEKSKIFAEHRCKKYSSRQFNEKGGF